MSLSSQKVTNVTNVTPDHNLSQTRHAPSQGSGFISLTEVGDFLAKGGAPTHLKHKIIELLAILREDEKREEEMKQGNLF